VVTGETNRYLVYQEKAGVDENKEHIVEMFYDILEHFGEFGSKRDEKRLFVEWRKQ